MGMALAGRPGAIVILFCTVVLLLGMYQAGNRSPLIEQLIQQFCGALFLALSTTVSKPQPTSTATTEVTTSSTKGPDGA
jgi:hypothetical protein